MKIDNLKSWTLQISEFASGLLYRMFSNVFVLSVEADAFFYFLRFQINCQILFMHLI